MKNVLLFTALMGFFVASCTKQRQCPATFELPATLFPIKRTYHVGDTLFYVSKFHKNVNVRNDEEESIGTIDMEGVDWQPLSFLVKIDTILPANDDAYSDFVTYCEYLKDDSCSYAIKAFSNHSVNSRIYRGLNHYYIKDSTCNPKMGYPYTPGTYDYNWLGFAFYNGKQSRLRPRLELSCEQW